MENLKIPESSRRNHLVSSCRDYLSRIQSSYGSLNASLFYNACGALSFSFFARPKNETKKRRRHRMYSPDGEAALWSRSA
jgi:hypothetical protein